MVHHVSFVFRVTIVWFNLYLFRNISIERGSLRRGAYNLVVALLNTLYNNTKTCYNIMCLYIIYTSIYIYSVCISDNFKNTSTSLTSLTSLTASCTQQDDETCESHTFLRSSPALWMAGRAGRGIHVILNADLTVI